MPSQFVKSGIVLVGAILLVAGGFFVMHAKKAEAAAAPLRPVEIDIPSITAKIPIVGVGVTSTDNLDVPHNFVQAGWYEEGPLPGAAGTAVIDGHVDNGGINPTVAGVFKDLYKVAPGDVISVLQSDGGVVNFKVISLAVYLYTKFPSSLVFGQTNDSLLNIITCNGKWLPYAGTYNKRLVVTAVRV